MNNLMNQFIDLQQTRLLEVLYDDIHIEGFESFDLNLPIIFVGSGSSLNAAKGAYRYFKEFTNNRLLLMTPMEYNSNDNIQEEEHILISISQTGSSIATLDTLKHARDHGLKTIFLTANQTEKIVDLADVVINLKCIEENIGPKTLGFTSTFVRLAQLALDIGLIENRMNHKEKNNIIRDIENAINVLPKVKKNTLNWLRDNQEWKNLKYATVAGEGYEGIGEEGALKLLETMRLPVNYYEIGEFTHGPHRLLKPDSFHIFISSKRHDGLIKKVIQYATKLGSKTLFISTLKEESDIFLEFNGDWGIEIPISLVFQVLSNELALATGFNPDLKVHPDFFEFVGTKN